MIEPADATEWGGASYVEHFEFREPPFDLSPDPRFAQGTGSQVSPVDVVTDSVLRRESLIVVTGAEGTGKTTLCLGMAQRFGARTFLSILLDPPLTAIEFAHRLLADFGLISAKHAAISLPGLDDQHLALDRFLISLETLEAHAVVVIDQAQRLPSSVLDEVLRLSNFTENHPGLLQIVLVGDPSLDGTLQQESIGPLNLRIASRHRLQPLQRAAVGQYIERRLWIAHGGLVVPATPTGSEPTSPDGPGRRRFTRAAVAVIAQRSAGTPRKINALCDRALTIANERAADSVGFRIARRAASDLGLQGRFQAFLAASPTAVAAAIVSFVGAMLLMTALYASGRIQATDGGTSAPQALSFSTGRSFAILKREALQRATALSTETNVKGLLKLQDEVQLWDSRTRFASHTGVQGLLGELGRITLEAQRRQLELDRTQLLEDSGTH